MHIQVTSDYDLLVRQQLPIGMPLTDIIASAVQRLRDAPPAYVRPVTLTGEMAITTLYMRDQLGNDVQVLCSPKLYAEIKQLEAMTLAERIAERDAGHPR